MPSNIPADRQLARFEQNENHDACFRRYIDKARQDEANSTVPFEWGEVDPEVAEAVDAFMAKLCKPIEEVI